jgi:two-component system, NarL family, sensor histidine kinase DevS
MEPRDLDPSKLGRLLEVGRALVAEREPDAVLIRVLNEARELTGARYAAMGILDEEKTGLARFLTVGIDDEMRQRIGPLPQGHGILGELIRTPAPLRLARISEHPRSYGFPADHPAMETFLGVPVRIRDEVYGNVYLTEKAGGAEFDDTDEELLIILAEWAAVAVDNARAHAQSRRDKHQIEVALRGLEETAVLNREVVGRGDLDLVTELAVKRGRSLADARSAVLLLVDGDTLKVVAVAGEVGREVIGREAPEAGSIAVDVLRAGRGQLITPDVAARFSEANPAGGSGVIVPLRARGADIGVLAVFDRLDPEHPLGSDDVVALESFASSAATRIMAARALEDERLSLSISYSERERRRWARELHDETLQELGALNVMQESALQVDDDEAAKTALARSNEQVGQIIAGLQGLITELRPAALDQLGVGPAVEVLVDRVRSRSGLDASLDLDLAYDRGEETTRLSPELEATIYRLVQEALTNVVKHAGATHARVRVEEAGAAVTVTVEDDGHGFDAGASNQGFGLLGMRERAALSAGELSVESSPQGGARVTAKLPVQRARQDGAPG